MGGTVIFTYYCMSGRVGNSPIRSRHVSSKRRGNRVVTLPALEEEEKEEEE